MNIPAWFIAVLATIWVEVTICLYWFARMHWVHKTRVMAMTLDVKLYERLPSFVEMAEGHGFWRWDVGYFIDRCSDAK